MPQFGKPLMSVLESGYNPSGPVSKVCILNIRTAKQSTKLSTSVSSALLFTSSHPDQLCHSASTTRTTHTRCSQQVHAQLNSASASHSYDSSPSCPHDLLSWCEVLPTPYSTPPENDCTGHAPAGNSLGPISVTVLPWQELDVCPLCSGSLTLPGTQKLYCDNLCTDGVSDEVCFV